MPQGRRKIDPDSPGVVPVRMEIVQVGDLEERDAFKLFDQDPNTIQAISDSIRTRGYDMARPIVVGEGPWANGRLVLVEGHQRVGGMRNAGVTEVQVVIRYFETEQAAKDYVLHEQFNRRNSGDRELFRAIQANDERSRAGRPPKKLHQSDVNSSGRSSAKTAAKFGTSSSKVERARTILKHGGTAIIQAVSTGKKTIHAAYNEIVAGLNSTKQARKKSRRVARNSSSCKVTSPDISPPRGGRSGHSEDESETDPQHQINTPTDCFGEYRRSSLCQDCSAREACMAKTEASQQTCFALYPGDEPSKCPNCPMEKECMAETQPNQSKPGPVTDEQTPKKEAGNAFAPGDDKEGKENLSHETVTMRMSLLDRIEEAACRKDWQVIEELLQEMKTSRASFAGRNDWISHVVEEFAPGNIDYVVFGQGPIPTVRDEMQQVFAGPDTEHKENGRQPSPNEGCDTFAEDLAQEQFEQALREAYARILPKNSSWVAIPELRKQVAVADFNARLLAMQDRGLATLDRKSVV